MDIFELIVVGGGASGFMSAITAAENDVKRVIILELSTNLLEKVRNDHAEILENINTSGKLEDDIKNKIIEVIELIKKDSK